VRQAVHFHATVIETKSRKSLQHRLSPSVVTQESRLSYVATAHSPQLQSVGKPELVYSVMSIYGLTNDHTRLRGIREKTDG
jgi:hypothetical protein